MKIILKAEAPVSEVLSFAERELRSYLSRMGYPDLTITLAVADMQALGMPAVEKPELDDQYIIDVQGPEGKILGGNERSVLLAVYDYLSLIGCSFLRPGKQFEVVPTLLHNEDFYASAKRTASLRHRGVCIEGSNSIDNILDFLDWLPKVGYNSFFPQFEFPQTFLERFYNTDYNPYRPAVDWTMEQSRRVMGAMDEAMLQRGIIQHRVGHGWTSRALGCKATGWETETKEFTEKERMMIAEVNGKREIWQDIPTNTNLCMSNPDAIEAFADGVVKYALANPSTDYLHLWLADDMNNQCECENCRKMRPSDHYINLLNRVDERLTEAGSDVKLVMLLYVDLLWAPQVKKLNHPDRFLLMFAPITRTFQKSFDQITIADEVPEFVLNKLHFPRELEYNLKFLQDWEEATQGTDCFDYDYYLGRCQYGDPTHINMARIFINDFKMHKKIGMNGISSCQNLRNHFPNGFSGYAMGQITSDTSKTYEELAAKYYTECYGPEGLKVLDVMERISACFQQDYFSAMVRNVEPEYAKELEKVPALAEELTELVDCHVPCFYEAQEKMWTELDFAADYITSYANVIKLRAEGKKEEAIKAFDEDFRPLINNYDMIDQSALDIWRINWCAGLPIRADYNGKDHFA